MTEKAERSEFPALATSVVGIDIASEFHVVAIPKERSEEPIRTFPAHSEGLREMTHFLKDHGIEEAAMEATGIYWVPVYNMLEENGIRPVLLNPHSIKVIPGHKSDVKDSEWIRRLYSHGLVRPCHVPASDISNFRELVRARENFIQQGTIWTNMMIKELRLMNINLEKAVTDVQGKTGMSIINAIVSGQRDPKFLASLRDKRCKKTEREIALHLDGVYTTSHVVNLKRYYTHYTINQHTIKEYDADILMALERFPSADPDCVQPTDSETVAEMPKKRLSINQYNRDFAERVRSQLERIMGTDITLIEGVGSGAALTIMSEIGPNVKAFPSSSQFASWLGLCPASNISGGKILGRSTRKVKNRIAQALRMCARSLSRSSTFLGGFFKKMRARQGPQQAITSTAHKMARLIYGMLKNGTAYVMRDIEAEEARQREYLRCVAAKKAEKLGLFVLRPGDPLYEEASRAAAERAANGGVAA